MKRIVVVEDVTIFASHRVARAFAAFPQRTSEECVGYGALVGNPYVARYKKTIAIVSSLVSTWHDRKTGTIIDTEGNTCYWKN